MCRALAPPRPRARRTTRPQRDTEEPRPPMSPATDTNPNATPNPNPIAFPPAAEYVPPGCRVGAGARLEAEWNSTLGPSNPLEVWLVKYLAWNTVKLDQHLLAEDLHRHVLALRAGPTWDDDRRADA